MSNYTSLIFLVIFVIFQIAHGAVFRTRPSVLEGHPGKCYHANTNTFYRPGEGFDLRDQCGRLVCLDDFSFSGLGCGKIAVSDELEISPVDLSKPHPECCPRPRLRSRTRYLEDNTI